MRVVFLAFLLGVLLLLASAARSDSQPDTVTLTREQIDKMLEEVETIMARREREAFKAGVQYQRQACASLI